MILLWKTGNVIQKCSLSHC